jgi:outer membrane biosynthesis protein TonB
MEAIMQWLMKWCSRGAPGLIAAALLLAGVPAQAKAVSGAPEAASREGQQLLLAQSKTPQEKAEQVEKPCPEGPQKKPEMGKQQQPQPEIQPKKLKTRGAIPEAAPDAVPAKPGGKRFGAGVVRNKESGSE